MNMGNLKPARVSSPGSIIRRELKERGWTQKQLAEIIGRPEQAVSEIINSKKRIVEETARELALAFNTSPDVWINLENKYRLFLSEKNASDPVKDKNIVRKRQLHELLPIPTLIKRGWIENTPDLDLLEKQVFGYLGIRSIDQVPALSVNLRHSQHRGPQAAPEVAWVERVKRLVSNQPVNEYSDCNLKLAIEQLYVCMEEAENIVHVPNILTKVAGIHFIIVPHLPKTYLDGAAFICDDGNPVVAMSLRYNRVDYFWFTLMHELAHISLGHESVLDRLENHVDDHNEIEANEWAREHLINQAEFEHFIRVVKPYYAKEEIERFAATQKVHPGIVLGQLQKRGEVKYKSMRELLVKVKQYLIDWIDKPDWNGAYV